MRFFTRPWHTGGLTDAEFDACIPAYQAHLNQIAPHLTPHLHAFIYTINLHDGQMHHVRIDHDHRSIAVTIRCGDLQQGYQDVVITYTDVALDQVDRTILALAASDPKMEILADEIDLISTGAFRHSFLFAPLHEITIIFGDFSYQVYPKSDRRLPRSAPTYHESGADRMDL
jgi:hypothetical protein